eukprot:2985693-Rhodomonas_salina.1
MMRQWFAPIVRGGTEPTAPPSPRPRSRRNIASQLFSRQTGGCSITSLSKLPQGMLRRLVGVKEAIPRLVLQMEEAQLKGDIDVCRKLLVEASKLLRENHNDPYGDGNSNAIRDNFILLGGAQCLVQLLQ